MKIRRIRGKGATLGPLHLQVLIEGDTHTYRAEIFDGHERKDAGGGFASTEEAQRRVERTARAMAPEITEALSPWEDLTEE